MLHRLLRGGGNYLLYGISNRYFYHPPINHQVNGRVPSSSMRQIVGMTSNSYKPITKLVLVVEEAGVPGENHQPWASNW
jgi:hypothetical protein